MGLAAHNHHDAYNLLPSGGIGWTDAVPEFTAVGSPVGGIGQKAGPFYQILPYVEQAAVWKGAGGTTIAECQINVIKAVIKIYFCPSRRSPAALPPNASWYGPAGTYEHGPIDYASSNNNTNANDGTNGAMVYGYVGMKLGHIKDGTTNTLMFGEKEWILPIWVLIKAMIMKAMLVLGITMLHEQLMQYHKPMASLEQGRAVIFLVPPILVAPIM